jgi:multidrug efflux pump subunit AcrB
MLNVRGPDYRTLASLAERTFGMVRATSGIRDPAISYRPGMPEQRLEIDRTRSGDLAVPYAAVAATLRTALDGDVVAKFRDGQHDSDVRVQLQASDRAGVESLGALLVPSRTGRLVHVNEVTRLTEASTPATIERLNRERQITISANVIGAPVGDVIARVQEQLDRMDKPAGYSFLFTGDAEMMGDASKNMGIALGLAVIFIYLVLASQFESLVHPFTIMLALPLAVVGALASLFLASCPIGMPAMIGIVLLMGLVTKNSILLVDYTNQLRARGLGIREALLEAGPVRLRPILMTSAAMVLGMLPTAIGRGEGSEFRAPMSIAVIGGVITSTILTLVVVPVVYVWADRLRLRGKRPTREPAPGAIPESDLRSA